MLIKKAIIGSIASLGLALGVASSGAVAQMNHEMPASSTSPTNQFRRIEQPLWVKATVATGGLALIGLELWWFLLSKPKSQKAQAKQGTAIEFQPDKPGTYAFTCGINMFRGVIEVQPADATLQSSLPNPTLKP